MLATNALGWARSVRADRSVAVAVAALTGGSDVSGILTGGERLSQRRQVEIVGAGEHAADFR